MPENIIQAFKLSQSILRKDLFGKELFLTFTSTVTRQTEITFIEDVKRGLCINSQQVRDPKAIREFIEKNLSAEAIYFYRQTLMSIPDFIFSVYSAEISQGIRSKRYANLYKKGADFLITSQTFSIQGLGVDFPGVIEITFQLIPGKGYKMVELWVSNTLLKRLLLEKLNPFKIYQADYTAFVQKVEKAKKEERRYMQKLTRLKTPPHIQQTGIKNLAECLSTLYEGDESKGLPKYALQVKHLKDKTFHTIIRQPIIFKDLVAYRMPINTNQMVTFYVREEGKFSSSTCVLSSTRDPVIQIAFSMLEAAKLKQVDLSELSIEISPILPGTGSDLSPEELIHLSPRVRAFLYAIINKIDPCKDQEGKRIQLEDLLPSREINLNDFKESIEKWMEKKHLSSEQCILIQQALPALFEKSQEKRFQMG